METSNKYLQVETYIKQAIDKGVFRAEDKLPSIRHLCEQLDVSKNTVIRAYQELEAVGCVYSVPRSGYRVSSTQTITSTKASAPMEVDLLSMAKSILGYPEGNQLLATGSAHPNTDFPAIKSLYATIGRHSRHQTQMPSHYQLPPGNDRLVQQLLKISQDLGISSSKNEIAVTNGAQQAITLALRVLTNPGDIVIVESPCYFGNLLLLQSLGLKALEIPSQVSTGIDIESVRKAIALWDVKAILVTPNFNNPTGSQMPLEKRQALLDVTQSIPIIEDDVFGGLSAGKMIPSLKSLDNTGRVIYVNSLSKTLDSRLRIGWLLSDGFQKQIEAHMICENMGSLNLTQSATGEFLTTGKYRTHVDKMKRFYQQNLKQFSAKLTRALDQYESLKGQYHLSRPNGSFLTWLTLPTHANSHQIYLECKNHKINILPGTVFATDEQYIHCIRLSVANFKDNAQWDKGIQKLAEIIYKNVHR